MKWVSPTHVGMGHGGIGWVLSSGQDMDQKGWMGRMDFNEIKFVTLNKLLI